MSRLRNPPVPIGLVKAAVYRQIVGEERCDEEFYREVTRPVPILTRLMQEAEPYMTPTQRRQFSCR